MTTRITFRLDAELADYATQRGAERLGGMSGYVRRLILQDFFNHSTHLPKIERTPRKAKSK